MTATASRRSAWLLCALVLVCMGVAIAANLARRAGVRYIAEDLVCREELAPVDAIIIENFDPNYLLFERAEALYAKGYTQRVLVPTEAAADSTPAVVARGFAEVMSRVAGLSSPELVPIKETEPIEFNAARQVRERLMAEHVRSVMLVTGGLRSKRSDLVYKAVVEPAGIRVLCMPVFGRNTPDTWSRTWHGVQEVVEQSAKLQYYRFYVLPFYRRAVVLDGGLRVDHAVDDRTDGVHDRSMNLLDPRRRLFSHVEMNVGVGAHPTAITAGHRDRR